MRKLDKEESQKEKRKKITIILQYRGLAFPGFKLTQRVDWSWPLHPLNGFPIINDPNVLHPDHFLEKSLHPGGDKIKMNCCDDD